MINILLNLKNAPPTSFKKNRPKDSSRGLKMSDANFVSKYLKTALLLITVFFTTNNLFAQPSRVEGTWVTGSYVSTIGTLSARTAINGTTVLAYRGQSTATSATRTLLFNNASTNYNPKWVANNATPLSKNTRLSGGAVRFTSGGTDINFATTQNSYYTFIIGNNGGTNNDLAIWETSYNPTTISSVSRNFSTVDATQSPTITVTMANALGTNERVYVYYSTDNFATSGNSAFVQLSALNGSFQGTASIPTFTAGTTVTYYVLTTANTTPTFADVQYQSLNIFNGTAQNTTAANFSYTVTAAGPTPTITLGTTSGTFSGNVGATSGVQTSTVTGANLTANITVTAPAYYEVSSDGSTWASSATFTQSGGNVSGTLSIRYKPTAGENAVLKNISVASTGATTVNYAATGTATNTITIQFQQPGTWTGSGFLYAFNGTGYNPAGLNAAFPGVAMTSIGSGWWTTTFSFTSPTIDLVISNGGVGGNKQTNNITGVTSSTCYTLTGTITPYGFTSATCPSGPTVGVTPTTATFSTTVGGTSGSQTFAVSGSFLTANIVVTAPAFYQVSTDNSSWSATGGTVSYTPSSGTVSANLYVRYVPTGAESAVAKSVSLASTGATTQNITVTGTTSSLKVSNAVTGLWTDGSSWVGGVAPSTIDVVQIVSGANITINSNFTQTGAITVDAGGKLTATSPFVTNSNVAINGTFTIGGSLAGGGSPTVTGSGTWTYGSASTLEFRTTATYNYDNNNDLSWPVTNGPFNVSLISATTNQNGLQINNNLARTINGTLLVQNTNNLYKNGSGGYTVNGTVQINPNGVFGNPVVTYGASSTLLFNTGTTVTSMSGPWITGTGGPGAGLPANVQISSNTTLTIPNSANYTVKGNLTIDSGSAVNTPSANALTVSGSVLNSGTLTLGGSANGDINVGGNWTNSGTFTHNSRTVTFNGTGNQAVSKTGGESFQNVVVNKSSGNLNPDSDINIAGNFTITSGNVQNASGSAKTITMSGSAPTLSVAGSFTGGNLGGGNNIHLIYSNTTGTLNISGAGATCSFTDLNLSNAAATINLSRSIAVHGTFTVNGTLKLSSGYFISNGSPIYGSSSLLLYNSGGSPTRGLEWTSATSGAGYPNNVQVGFATTLGLGTTSAQTAGFLLIDFNSTVNTTTNILTVLGSVDVSGTISLGGDVKVGGNWTIGTSGSQLNNNKAVFFIHASNNQTVRKLGGGIVFFDYLVLDKAAGDVVIDSASEIQILTTNGGNVLQLNNAGQLDLNGRTLTLGGSASNISVNAAGRTIKGASGSTVVVNGPKTVVSSGGGTLIFDTNVKLALSSTFNFGASVTTINGVLELNSGYGVSNSPSYGTSSLLKYNSGGLPSRSTEWNSASGYGYPNDVQIAFATTLIPGGNGLQGTALNLARDLTIDQNSSLYLDYAALDMTVPLKVGRNAIINGNLSLSNSSGGDMEVGGNWTHTTGTFFPDARKVTFNGTNGNQTITNTGGETFYDLTINNGTANVLLAASTNVTVSNALALSAGEFVSGSNTLTLNGTVTRTSGTLTTAGSSIVFGPNAAALTLPNSVFTASPTSLVNLTVNRAGGITLGNQGITASGTLTLTDGIVTTGSNIVSLTRSNASPITGGNSSTYISGKLEITYPATGTNVLRVFPIGKGGAYRPVEFIYNTDPGSRSVLLEQFETGSPFPTNSTASTTTFGTRYWTVTQSSTGVPFRIGLNNGGITPSAGDVVILRKDSSTITLDNGTLLIGSSYRNLASNLFDASVVANDVALGITNIPLVINGITGINSKIYDSTTSATPIGTATLSGIISGDTVTLTGTPVYSFNNKNVGTAKAVTVTGYTLSGTNAGAYALPSPNQIAGLTGNITARPLVVTASTDTREYDQTNSSSATPTITTGVLQGSDSANFSQTFDNKNVGQNKTLTAAGAVNDGNSGNNYSYTFNTNTTGEITPKALTLIDLGTADKQYDTTSNANFVVTVGGAAPTRLAGIMTGDIVGFSPSGYFSDGVAPVSNVGTWTVISTTTLTGADKDNYTLLQPTFAAQKDITPIALTVTGAITSDKEYDGTNVATITGGTLNGVLSGQTVTLNLSGTYSSKNAGGPYLITSTSTLGGANASNYILSPPSLTPRSILGKALTITGATTSDKEYDGNNSAVVTGGSLVGVVPGDSVILTQSGTYSSKNVGTWPITSTSSLSGTDAGNYTLTQPSLAAASITAKPLTISGATTSDKAFDGTNVATIGGTLAGVVSGDDVILNKIATYSSAAVGGPYAITSTSTITGNDNANYTLTQPTLTPRSITPIVLTVSGVTVSDKVYDGTRTATVNTTLAVLDGVLPGDDVVLDVSGVSGLFNTKNVANGKPVALSGFTLSGADVSNYDFSQPTATANITPRALTITATDQTKCAGSPFSYNGNEFSKDFNVSGDVTGVTLTIVGGADGATQGNYVLRPSAATGAGVGNYSPITYIDGSLVVNGTPTATISGSTTTCLNDSQPLVTFTGANGSGTVRYRFYYRINGGSELSIASLSGISTATVSVPTTTARTDVYTLTRVEDLNSGCQQAQSGSATYTVGLCTQIRPNQCGKTLPALNTSIEASAIASATQYRFEVTRTDTNTVYPLITSSNYYFSPATQIPGGLVYGKSYSIRVQIFSGSWLAFGGACTVTAPAVPTVSATKIRANQCGTTLPNIDTAIQAAPVYLATQYKFEVTPQGGAAVEVTTPNYFFSLTSTAGLAVYNKAYSIRVNALSGGVWTGYGDPCIITTPNVPATKLINSQCGVTFNNLTFTLNASNVILATKYRFRVVNGPTERIVEVARNFIIPSDLAGGYANNTVYTVDVATLYNGLWSAYGPACTVTTPFVRMASETINTNVFEVKAFPNPFARHFSLDIQSSSDDLVQVQVYDMIGRELEVQKATVSELSTREIGTNYPSGVYNVVVSQGDKVKSVRMIKR